MEKQTAIDYAPLQIRYSFIDSYRYLNNNSLTKTENHPIAIVLILVILYTLITIFIFELEFANVNQLIIIISTLFLAIAIAVFLRYSYELKTSYKKHQFANINNGQYLTNIYNPSYDGIFFRWGNARIINEEYQLITNAGLVKLGNYSFSLSSFNTYQNGYITVELNKQVPNIILDSKKNNLFNKISNVRSMFKKAQFYDLEGDFNNYFTAIIPNDYGTDALYLLTPDVMATFVDNATDYDIELVSNQLYLYKPGNINTTSPQEIDKLISAIISIRDNLEKQTNVYKDERTINPTEIHFSGKKLQDTLHPGVIMVIMGIIGTIALVLTGNASFVFSFIALVIVVGGFFVWPFKK